jgi:hypothetical protein
MISKDMVRTEVETKKQICSFCLCEENKVIGTIKTTQTPSRYIVPRVIIETVCYECLPYDVRSKYDDARASVQPTLNIEMKFKFGR